MQEEPKAIGFDFSAASREAIELFVDASSDDSVFEEILAASKTKPDIVKILYDHPNTPDSVRAEASKLLSLPVPSQTQVAQIIKITEEAKAKIPEEVKQESLMMRIKNLTISGKVKLGMKGGSEARSLLLRESNKQVTMAVLNNPRLTDSEVVGIARNRSALDETLRKIAGNREWMKKYAVLMALVQNPKTPPGIAMNLIGGLNKKDLKLLEKNKGVSEGVRTTAKRTLQMKEKSGG